LQFSLQVPNPETFGYTPLLSENLYQFKLQNRLLWDWIHDYTLLDARV